MTFKDKTLLITGGTGSFGNAMVDRLLETDIKEIRIFSRDEKKQDEMRHKRVSDKLTYHIGDVRDASSIESAVRGVDYIFCAAALKQVPSCEFFPMEAVKTNVEGVHNTLKAATVAGVERVVVLSTDKAVYPVNAMGMSKALMEKVAIAQARSLNGVKPNICITRYGNVMASRGSVIPLFISQIKAGKDVTITDPDMTRFIMSLQEAVELVLFAFEKGLPGDTFIKKAPAATIGQLARVIASLFKSKSEIKVIGTRHGEKKHETLLNREELSRSEDMGDFYRVHSDMRSLQYDKFFVKGETQTTQSDDYTSENTYRLSDEELTECLLNLDYVQNELKS